MPFDLTERFGPPALRIRHYGYLKNRIDERDKHQRNLELLQRRARGEPARRLHALQHRHRVRRHGRSRVRPATLRARAELLREEHAWWELGYAPILVSRLCGVRRLTGDLVGSEALANELLGHFPAFTDLVFERALVAQDRGELEQAAVLFERCLGWVTHRRASRGWSDAARSWRSGRSRSSPTNRGLVDEAAGWFERSLELHPEYLAAGLDLTALLLSQPDADPDAVLARLEAYAHDELTWYLFLGTAFYERGHAEHAEGLLRRCLAIGGGHAAARVGLLEALVTQRRYAEVETRSAISPRERRRSSRRSVCGCSQRCCAGDRENAESALTALAAGGGDDDEVAMLRAAVAAVLDGSEPPALSRRSALRALELLNGLARLAEYAAFESVVPVVEQAVGDPREATLLIGELYLARGFYRLAGDSALRRSSSGARTRARSACSARAPSPRACSRMPCRSSRRRWRWIPSRPRSPSCSRRSASGSRPEAAVERFVTSAKMWPWDGRHSISGVTTSPVSNRSLAELASTRCGACASTGSSPSVGSASAATPTSRGRPSCCDTSTVKG